MSSNAAARLARPVLFLAFVLSWLFVQPAALAQDADRKLSPFEELRWDGDTPIVLIGQTWYQPATIQGVKVSQILDLCEKRWPGMARRRFGEDLVEAMTLMGHEPPDAVNLTLYRIDDAQIVTLRDVPMTRANRNAIRDAANGRPAPPPVPEFVTQAQARDDLAEFEARLRDRFAYLNLRPTQWESNLDEIRRDLPDPVSSAWLTDRLTRLMARFGDGHAGVYSLLTPQPQTYPPFLLEQADLGVVAFRTDRTALLDDSHPYLAAIDGVPLDTWLDTASQQVAAGSEQLVRFRALRDLRNLEFLRDELGRPAADSVRVTLRSEQPDDEITLDLPMTPDRPIFGEWPRTATRTLPDNLGYLRLPEMDDDLVPALRDAMDDFTHTRGLIVDVRGNGGGSRDLLLALAGYLLAPDESPWVANAARYLDSGVFTPDLLEARFLYRADDPRWTAEQRHAIERFTPTFAPEFTPTRPFSDWHYLVLDRTSHPREYFYDKSVVVLMDAGCFSATDIFLGALKGRPRVTLMGTPSSGGSARTQSFTLPHSQIQILCASMISFRPDGRLYDGRGIEPDHIAAPAPSDFLIGGTDTILDRAVRFLAQPDQD